VVSYINKLRMERYLISSGLGYLVEECLILGLSIEDYIDPIWIKHILNEVQDLEFSSSEIRITRQLLEVHWNED